MISRVLITKMLGCLTVPLNKCLATGVLILLSLGHCQAQIGGTRSEIKIIDNGYEGILIAIENNVAEDQTLIERIKVGPRQFIIDLFRQLLV